RSEAESCDRGARQRREGRLPPCFAGAAQRGRAEPPVSRPLLRRRLRIVAGVARGAAATRVTRTGAVGAASTGGGRSAPVDANATCRGGCARVGPPRRRRV